jgi:sulfite exporter TauE/SafE
MSIAVLFAAFVLGIGGSLHCLGMCGPLALSIPYNNTGHSKVTKAIYYYLAKAVSYGCMGALVGLFGKGLFMMNWQQGLSIAAGIFIIIWTCFPAVKPGGTFFFQKQFSFVYNKLQDKPKVQYYFFLGFLNGLLPCGMVYAALAIASVSGGMAQGFLTLFVFGIGTTPILIALVLLKNRMSAPFRQRLKPVSMVLSIVVGALLILRGMDLGIRYISPMVQDKEVKGCCSKH